MGKVRKILGLVLCILLAFGNVVYADNDNDNDNDNDKDKSLVIQENSTFQKKGGDFSPHAVDSPVTFYVFLTNNGQTQLRSTTNYEYVTIELTSPSKKTKRLSGYIPPTGRSHTPYASDDLTTQDDVTTFQFTFNEEGTWSIYAYEDDKNSKDFNGTIQINKKKAIGLVVSPVNQTISVGDTLIYTAEFEYNDGTTGPADSVQWSSSDPSIASIDSSGLAKGKDIGAVYITASDRNTELSGQTQLTVISNSSSITPSSATIWVGGTQQFEATWIVPFIGQLTTISYPFSVTWSMNNSAVATVDQKGLVYGVSAGTANVKATLYLWVDLWFFYIQIPVSTVSAPVTVNDLIVDSVTIAPRDPTINVGDTQPFTVTAHYTNNTSAPVTDTQEISWSSSNQAIASISDGLATGLSSGQTEITATYKGKSDMATLTVNIPQGDRFRVVDQDGNPGNPSLQIRADYSDLLNSTWGYIGEPMKITVYLQAVDANNSVIPNFTWDSTLLEWLRVTDNWGITVTGNGDPSQRSLQVDSVNTTTIKGIASVMAQFTVLQDDSDLTRQKKIDFSIRFSPTDEKMPTVDAVVPGSQGTQYTLYGGRIHVADEYFYYDTGNAYIFVERYDGTTFVQNTPDSRTGFSGWTLGSQSFNTQKTFQNGQVNITMPNDTSSTSLELTPFGYPSYLAIVPGILTWGQIINVPPPGENNEGPVWEQELPPS